ncbi:uncharacterized protein LOC128963542 [Oppia nitens]|uniref:uncharacterized protein LOC128963542 n=1 Tax=Oppia nitens TaxID=1686743 RepID=UPI0023DA6C12|nr:uncharacterized protein LOC128963542 [Oppia nitens]
MGCRKNFRILLKVIISVACLTICSYQIYIVGILYLSYPTTIDLRVSKSLNVHLPGITICTEISTTILPEKIVEIQPTLYSVLHGKSQRQVSYLLRKKAFRQLLEEPLRTLPIHLQHQYTINANNFFDKCEVPTPVGYQKGFTYSNTKINCSAISKIVETISYDTKCYTLFYNNVENYDQNKYKIKRDMAANLKYLAWIRLNRDYILNGLIFIHSPKELHQYSVGNNVMQINPNTEQFVGISFTRQTTSLLPHPYATQCKNYSLEGFTSRDHCLADCKVTEYTRADGWPGDIFATNNITYTFSNLWINKKSPSGHLEEGLSVDELCRKKCGDFEDCYNIFYEVKALRIMERDEDDYEQNDWITIGILPPKSVDMTLVHQPKYETVELAIYIGGLISLYLGVSVVSVIVAIFAFITFTAKPFSRKKKYTTNVKTKDYKNGIQTNGLSHQNSQPVNNTGADCDTHLVDEHQSTTVAIPEAQQTPRARLPGILHFMSP